MGNFTPPVPSGRPGTGGYSCTSLPFFVVRPFIEKDWHFIYRHSQWQGIYLKRFGVLPAIPERSLSQRIQSLPFKLESWSQALLQKNL